MGIYKNAAALFNSMQKSLDDFSLNISNNGLRQIKRYRWKHIHLKESDCLDPQFAKEIHDYWKQYTNSFDMVFHKIYSSRTGVRDVKFIPDELHFTTIDQHFNNRKFWLGIDDKNYYSLWYPEAKQPATLARKINGIFYSDNYSLISLDEAIDRCLNQERLIIKPAVGTGGSKGIFFWEKADSADSLKKILLGNGAYSDLIAQEIVSQHEQLSRIHEHSLNTIRTMTLLFQGEVHTLSSVLRIGSGGSKVDNVSAGGFVCGINPDGRLKDTAWRSFQKYDRHPQGVAFNDIVVPSLEKVENLTRCLQVKMGHFRLISWDVAVNADGEPVLVEANLNNGACDIHQLCNGPLFGNLTDAVLGEVFGRGKL